MNALMRTVKDLYEKYCELSPKMSKDLIPNAMLTDDAVYLVDYIGGNMILSPDKKQTLLNENSIAKRLQLLASLLEGEINILTLERNSMPRSRSRLTRTSGSTIFGSSSAPLPRSWGREKTSTMRQMSTSKRSKP